MFEVGCEWEVRGENGLMVRSAWLIKPYLVPSWCDTMSQNYFVLCIFVFNILDPQVLENPCVFDSWLWVTQWLKPTQI